MGQSSFGDMGGGDLYDIKWVVLMLAYECAYKIVCPNPKPHDKKDYRWTEALVLYSVKYAKEEEVKH